MHDAITPSLCVHATTFDIVATIFQKLYITFSARFVHFHSLFVFMQHRGFILYTVILSIRITDPKRVHMYMGSIRYLY